ncbi:MAG: peptidoglycan editing factor PgeF [Alsobacter sp.]
MIQAPELDLPGVVHAFFTREGGVSTGIYASLNGGLGSADDRENVLQNRRRMAAALGVAETHLVNVHQVHSPDVVIADGPWPGDERPRADGMASRTPGVALAVASADCGPVLFADPQARVVGACHAGWRGAFEGVLERTVEAMESLGARRKRIAAVLGPTIGPHAYEVGPEFVTRFLERDQAYGRFFTDTSAGQHAFFDLPRFIGARLEETGVGAFADLGLCTYAHEERFFSYRRATHRGEPDYGRLISAIALAP